MTSKSSLLYPLLGISTILTIWFIITLAKLFHPLLLPSPLETCSALIELITTGVILPDLILTTKRTILSLILGITLGVPLGICAGSFLKIYQSLEFIVEFLRSIPAQALLPLFLLFFGIGETTQIALACTVTSLIIFVHIVNEL